MRAISRFDLLRIREGGMNQFMILLFVIDLTSPQRVSAFGLIRP